MSSLLSIWFIDFWRVACNGAGVENIVDHGTNDPRNLVDC